ncbi:MAG: hypothetical protein LBR27_11840 [Bifidobacteriaceae bacterium]|jgi:hypothetical protein|nr:hypothetical protein [Bifidobacteriaceae bacterium]
MAGIPPEAQARAIVPGSPGALQRAQQQDRVVLCEKDYGMRSGSGRVLGLVFVAIGLVLLGLGGAAVAGWFTPASDNPVIRYVAIGLGLLVVGIGVAAFKGSGQSKDAYLEIGPDGIVIHRGTTARLAWPEIQEVGLSLVYRREVAEPEQLLLPKELTTKVSSYLRLAPVVPGFAGRTDLAPLRPAKAPGVDAEPPPFTHRFLLHGFPWGPKRHAPVIDLLDAALRRFAGPRYTGVQWRRSGVTS